MEDIEYLEEYEDLVLPALNSAAAIATSSASHETNKIPHNLKTNEADDSSSSLDQDIFNCLFDDNSEDDEDFNEYQKSGGKVIEKVEISRQDTLNKFDVVAETVRITSSTPKPKTFMIKTSGTTIPLNTTTRPQAAIISKTKSIATVRPTIQNQQQEKNNLYTKSASSSTSSIAQQQNLSTSAPSTSRSVQLSVLSRKPLTQSTSLSTSSLIEKKSSASSSSNQRSTTIVKKINKPPATIVKPEKIITKDPATDPLELDDLSEAASLNHSVSDISGETYNSVSEFDNEEEYYSGSDNYYEEEDDEEIISSSSHIIELSNDSSCTRSNLEEIRPSTPSPVISDDSDTPRISSAFEISTTNFFKPYSHPDIILSVLRKGEKPNLLELLYKYNLLEDSEENDNANNTVIDITTSRENLVENFDTQQLSTLNNNLPSETLTIDSNKTANKKLSNKNQIENSRKTNKNKSKKKSVRSMDTRDLKSPGAISTDSDLSAVEELLEDSYAEAMNRVKDVSVGNQDVGAKMVSSREEKELTAIEESERNLPKVGVVIDYDKSMEEIIPTEKDIKISQDDEKNTDLRQPEESLKSEAEDKETNIDMEISKNLTSANSDQEQKETVVTAETITDNVIQRTKTECQETTKVLETVTSSTNDSPNMRKKKRFRNLLTPEPNESDPAKSIDDIRDFKGFEGFEEEVKSGETDKKMQDNNIAKPIEKISERTPEIENITEQDHQHGSFKSPSSSHQSLKDKAKESKEKSSRDSSKETKDKNTKHSKSKSSRDSSKETKDKNTQHSKSKSSRDNSKDRSSRESSKDKSSRESSKDRSRDSSKDRSKRSHSKGDFSSKHHHSDHRKSSDSKHSSKSRDSSKSTDHDEPKHTKIQTQEPNKSSSTKRDQSLETNKEREIKTNKKSDSHATYKKPTDTLQKPDEKTYSKSSSITTNDLKDKRDSSRESNIKHKTIDSTKIKSDTKQAEHPPKAPLDPKVSTTKPQQHSAKGSEISKNSQHKNDADKLNIIKRENDKSSKPKDTLEKNIIQTSKTPSCGPITPKSSSKSTEAAKKDYKKIIQDNKSDLNIKTKMEGQLKKDSATDLSKSESAKKESNKSDISTKANTETPAKHMKKDSVCSSSKRKHSESGSVKSENSTKESENVQKIKSGEIKSEDSKHPKETLEITKETKQTKSSEIKNKNAKHISMSLSPKRSPKPKEEDIKKSEAVTKSDAVKAKDQKDIKNFERVLTQKSEKMNTTDETKDGKNTTSTEKTNDSKGTIGSDKRKEIVQTKSVTNEAIKKEECKNNQEKKQVAKSNETSKNIASISAKKEVDKKEISKPKSDVNVAIKHDTTISSIIEESKIHVDKKEVVEPKSSVDETIKQDISISTKKESKNNEDKKEVVEPKSSVSETIKHDTSSSAKRESKNNVDKKEVVEPKSSVDEANKEDISISTKKESKNNVDKKEVVEPKSSVNETIKHDTSISAKKESKNNVDKKEVVEPKSSVDETIKQDISISTKKESKNNVDKKEVVEPKSSGNETIKHDTSISAKKESKKNVDKKEVVEPKSSVDEANKEDISISTKKEYKNNVDKKEVVEPKSSVDEVNKEDISISTKKESKNNVDKKEVVEPKSSVNETIKHDTSMSAKKESKNNVEQKEVTKPRSTANETKKGESKHNKDKKGSEKLKSNANNKIQREASIPAKKESKNSVEQKEVTKPKTSASEMKKEECKNNKEKKDNAAASISAKKEVEKPKQDASKEIKNETIDSTKKGEHKMQTNDDNKLNNKGTIIMKDDLKEDNLNSLKENATENETLEKSVTKNTPKQLESKSNVVDTTKKLQSAKEKQKICTIENTEPKNSGKSSTPTKAISKIIVNKDKTKDNTTNEKIVSTTRLSSSQQTPKRLQQETVAISDEKTKKQITNLQNISQVEKIEGTKDAQEEPFIATKTNSDTNRKDLENEDVVMVDENVSKGNVDEENQPNVDLTKSKSSEMVLNTTEETQVFKNTMEDNPTNVSKITKSHIESICAKSVIVLIEPLKLNQSFGINIDDEAAVEPRITRSRNETTKCSENKQTRRKSEIKLEAVKSESETSDSNKLKQNCSKKEKTDTNKNERMQIEKTEMKSDAIKDDEEKCDISQTNVLSKESIISEEKNITAHSIKKEIEKELIETTKTEKHKDLKTETQKENTTKKPKISSDHKEETEKEKTVTSYIELSDKIEPAQNEIKEETESQQHSKEDTGKETYVEKCSTKKGKKGEHMGTMKSRIKKEQTKQEKIEVSSGETLDVSSKMKATEMNIEPMKTRRCKDLKEEAEKGDTSEIESSAVKKSIQKETDDENFEPIKTRRRGDLGKEDEQGKTELVRTKPFDHKSVAQKELKGEDSKQMETNASVDLKPTTNKETTQIAIVEKSQDKSDILKETEKNSSKPIRATRRGDVKGGIANEKTEILPIEKSAEKELKDEHFEQIITRRRGDLKTEDEKVKSQISRAKPSAEKRLAPKGSEKEKVEQIKAGEAGSSKEEEPKASQLETLNKSHQENFEKGIAEQVKVRTRGDFKGENKCEEMETFDTQEEKQFEQIKTRTRGDLKLEATKEKTESNNDQLKPINTRRRADTKEETNKEKKEICQVQSLDSKGFGTKELKDAHVEQLTPKRRGDLKTETEITDEREKGKGDFAQEKKRESINTASKLDTPQKGLSNKKRSAPENADKRIMVEPIKTRTHTNPKGETDSLDEKESKDNSKPITTRSQEETGSEPEKKDNEMTEKNSTQDDLQQNQENNFEPRKTRSRADTKGDAANEKDEMCKKNLPLGSVADKKYSENKSKVNVAEEEQFEKIKLRNCKNTKEEDSANEKPLDNSQCETKKIPLKSIKTRSSGQDEKINSTADEKQSEEIDSTPPDNEAKQIQCSDENIALKTNLETETISSEVVCSENEMSGCESSSSISDNTFKRTLRKRGTDSPFSDNDNNRKKFKEPQLLTPKSAKIEKLIPNAFSITSKRTLRSPAPEIEYSSSNKKPKLETSKKSTRSRNLHEGCLEEEEYPIVTTEFEFISNEQSNLQEQPRTLDKEKINESSKHIVKTTQNKTSKEVKEISRNITVSEKKKIEVKVTDAAKTPKTSIIVLQNKDLGKESPKQSAIKDILDININKSKQEKTANVTNAQESTIKAKINEAKLTPTINKSPGSTVISFSDWLKTKSQNSSAEIQVIDKSTTTKENTPDISKRQSRIRAKLTPKALEPIPIVNKEETAEEAKRQEADTTLMCQNKEKDSSALQEEQQEISTVEGMNISLQLDDNLSQKSDNEFQNQSKQQDAKRINKKINVKRLQRSSQVSKSKVPTPPIKSKTTPTLTPPRAKRSETDLLIESMSKEMKDGGIKDLLKAEAHVKRHRLPLRRNIIGSTEQYRPIVTAATATTSIAKQPTLAASMKLQDVNPKVLDSSENMGNQTNILTPSDESKSPSKRKPQQNLGKSKKAAAIIHRDSSRADIVNSPDVTMSIQKTVVKDDPKALGTKARRLPIVSDLSTQLEKRTKEFANTDVIKSRKSMPLMPKESLPKGANLPSRKSLSISKLQQPREKLEIPESNVFKTPKQPQATNTEIIKKSSSVGDLKRPDNRTKNHQIESLLKKFKCRNLRVHLDRSVVQTYLNSVKNQKNQISRKRTNLKNVSQTKRNANVQPIIRNNSETNLRIQSVIDASTLLNSPMAGTQVAQPTVISRTPTLRGRGSNSIPALQQSYIVSKSTDSTGPFINSADANEIEFKNEFLDDNPIGLINEAILPDTPTLLARAQTITEAAQHALSNSVTPTDIRLLTTDSSKNCFVPSFGVTPTALDNKGTCMYTFLHPAKYNRNHSNVLLDYCCPNLDGPMPAIDPTRIHSQVQLPVIELPASIVLTTKVVTRADLESENSHIPAIIRKKAEKIRKNMATHHKLAVTTTTALPAQTMAAVTQPSLTPLPPTINALTKQLPSTTTITAKLRPTQSQQELATPPPPLQAPISSIPPSVTSALPKCTMTQLSNVQRASLRSNLRRFDVLLKQLVQPYDSLSFVERHRIIEAVISSGKCQPKDLEQTLVLMEEYIKQTLILKNDSLQQQQQNLPISSNFTSQPVMDGPFPTVPMPQLQPSPQILASNAVPVTYPRQFDQIHNKTVRKTQSKSKNTSLTSATTAAVIKQRQVPIYDTDRNIIGYQMQMMTPMSTIPAYTKSTMSAHTGAIMSTSLDSSNNDCTAYKRPVKRPAQDSPRVFYTTPPLKSSTPKAISNPPDIYTRQHTKNANTMSQKSKGSIVTTVRSAGASASATSETMTTTMATVKRVTRSTATGSKIIIVSKSSQSSEESILPDANSTQQQTEIKNEKDTEGFLE